MFVVFIDLVGFGIVIPILPYYVRSFGVGDVYIGLLAATYSLTQFLAAPTLGRLSDERGRRPIIMFSLAGSTVAWLIFGVAGQVGEVAGVAVGVGTLFAARALAGAMGGFLASPRVVAAASVLPVPATQYSLPAFGAAAMSLTALAVAAVVLAEPARKRTTSTRQTIVTQFATALGDQSLRGLVVAFFLVSTSAGDETQGAAFGVTQGAGSLGRTVGPPVAAALYAAVYWSPFVAGAVVVIPIIALLVRRSA